MELKKIGKFVSLSPKFRYEGNFETGEAAVDEKIGHTEPTVLRP